MKPCGNTVERLAAMTRGLLSFDEPAARRADGFYEERGSVLEALCGTEPFLRLSGIAQLGLKRRTVGIPACMIPFCGGWDAVPDTVGGQLTRREHSERVCASMVALCARVGTSFDDTLHGAAAALYHDLGHTAFSHTLEPLLRGTEYRDHERLGAAVLGGCGEIRSIFLKGNIGAGYVLKIMAEQGALGLHQKMVDTLAYVLHDSEAIGQPIDPSFASRLLGSVLDVGSTGYAVSDESPMRELLEHRARLGVDFYEHPYNRANSLMLRGIVGWMIAAGKLEMRHVAEGTDGVIVKAVLSAIEDAATPPWVVSACRFVLGRGTLAGWGVELCDPDARTDFVSVDEHGLVLHPMDISAKRLPVRLPSGKRIQAQASDPRYKPLYLAQTYRFLFSPR